MIYRYCHPCLANKEFRLSVVTARRGPMNLPRHDGIRARRLQASFREPKITVSGENIFPGSELPRLPGLKMMMMNRQVFDEMRHLLQKPRYIVNVDDYYIYRTWSKPTLTVYKDTWASIPKAESLVVNFIHTKPFSSAALAEAAQAANAEGNVDLAKELDDSSYFDSLSLPERHSYTGEQPPMILKPDDFEKDNKPLAGLAQLDREENLLNIVKRCVGVLFQALAFREITHLEVNLPTFAGRAVQRDLLKEILNIANDVYPQALFIEVIVPTADGSNRGCFANLPAHE